MRAMSIIGIILYGLMAIGGIYKITIELIRESKGIYEYTSGYVRDISITELFVIYAFIFSIVVFVKTNRKP